MNSAKKTLHAGGISMNDFTEYYGGLDQVTPCALEHLVVLKKKEDRN